MAGSAIRNQAGLARPKASIQVAGIFAVDVLTASRIGAGICYSLAVSLVPETLGPGKQSGPFAEVRGVPNMVAPIADGTDVWMAAPASPPLRMTIRARLDDHCRECGLPVYRCESEGGQILSLCAGHLRMPN